MKRLTLLFVLLFSAFVSAPAQAKNEKETEPVPYAVHITPFSVYIMFNREFSDSEREKISAKFPMGDDSEIGFYEFVRVTSHGTLVFKKLIQWKEPLQTVFIASYAQSVADIVKPGAKAYRTIKVDRSMPVPQIHPCL